MDRCSCGTNTFDEYLGNDNNLLGVKCKSCDQEWLRETRNPRERIILQGQEMGKYTHKDRVESGCLMTRSERSHIPPSDMNSLRKADHITWHRTCGIWHHAIVLNTFPSEFIEICHFDSGKYGWKIKAIIKTKKINLRKEDGLLYKINYSNIPEENSAELVVARTRVLHSLSRTGEYCYNVLTNNCENFATFCKTGTSISYQFKWLISQVQRAVINGMQTTYRIKRLSFLLRHIRCISDEKLSRFIDAVCAGVLVLGEVKMCYEDIGKINSNTGISGEDRLLEKVKRISECVVGVIAVGVGSYARGHFRSRFGSLIGGPLELCFGKIVGAWVGSRIATSVIMNRGFCIRDVLMYCWTVLCKHSFIGMVLKFIVLLI
ncbi:uncharacterized protein LOC128225267 [Mya arenaria]|uniref:uncharacterized protein LOC128225267 n=1 Tax=Mya arenaria TaxID=6604 RepID=UPI0022E4FFFA|nr:uncharacterized protein LOC128225267 [Mya arenaria]XP_052791341.1 uncharacterized protein LOC128225267 [Mya arenaria]